MTHEMIQRPPQTSPNLEFLGRIRIETDGLSPASDPPVVLSNAARDLVLVAKLQDDWYANRIR